MGCDRLDAIIGLEYMSTQTHYLKARSCRAMSSADGFGAWCWLAGNCELQCFDVKPGQKATICFGAYSVAIFMAVGSWAGGLWFCASLKLKAPTLPTAAKCQVYFHPTRPQSSWQLSWFHFCAKSCSNWKSCSFSSFWSWFQFWQYSDRCCVLSGVIWADSNASRLLDVKDNIATIKFHWHEEQLVPILKSTFWNKFFCIMCCIEAAPVLAVKHLWCLLNCLHSSRSCCTMHWPCSPNLDLSFKRTMTKSLRRF